MLIVYRKVTGEVVENTGTNSLYPDGIPDIQHILSNVVNVFGGKLSDYDVIRINDVKDIDKVSKTFTHEYTIQNGKIQFGGLKTIPEIQPPEPSEQEVINAQLIYESMIKDMKITELETSHSELMYQLMTTGVL